LELHEKPRKLPKVGNNWPHRLGEFAVLIDAVDQRTINPFFLKSLVEKQDGAAELCVQRGGIVKQLFSELIEKLQLASTRA
jgi:hypothetical protein